MRKLTVAAFALLLSLGSRPCAADTFTFNESSATDGADGNIRTFSNGSLNVHVSAFSRDKSSGAWASAWLGAYGTSGLGVTDSSEGSGSNDRHTVDNLGIASPDNTDRDNYVLFEFSEPIKLDKAYLGYVVADSDLTLWIGTKTNPFGNHQTLNDAFLASLGFTENNFTTSPDPRTADLNAGGVDGNVVVIAALIGDMTPEDAFKIKNFIYTSTTRVPDGGATIGLLALSLAGLSLIDRKRQ